MASFSERDRNVYFRKIVAFILIKQIKLISFLKITLNINIDKLISYFYLLNNYTNV